MKTVSSGACLHLKVVAVVNAPSNKKTLGWMLNAVLRATQRTTTGFLEQPIIDKSIVSYGRQYRRVMGGSYGQGNWKSLEFGQKISS